MTTEINDKQEAAVNIDEMTPSQLRSMHVNKFAKSYEERNQMMMRALDKRIDETTRRFTMKYIVENYLLHLMSTDEHENAYYAKLLSREIGSDRIPYDIIDERTGERIFRVHGVSPKLNTNIFIDGDLTDVDSVLSYSANISNRDYRVNKIPALREKAAQDLLEHAGDTMENELSEQIHYLGWYEILDYLGVIVGEEMKEYSDTRMKREDFDCYVFWAHPSKLLDYLDKHGVPQYPILADLRAGIVREPKKPSSTPQPLLPAIPAGADDDIEDWE